MFNFEILTSESVIEISKIKFANIAIIIISNAPLFIQWIVKKGHFYTEVLQN